MQQNASPSPTRLPRFFQLHDSSLSYLLLAGFLSLLYLTLFVFQARVDIELQTPAAENTFLRIYWAGEDQAFAEKRMSYAQLTPQRLRYRFYIGSLANIERIRIDPLEYAGQISLKSLRISQYGYAPIEFQTAADFAALRDSSEVEVIDTGPGGGLLMKTTGNDGHFEITLQPAHLWALPRTQLLTLFTIMLALALLMHLLRPLLTEQRFVPWLLLVALALTSMMALTTGLHQHPDEVSHLAAVEYYSRHLFQHPLSDPDAASSFSIYGYSRLAKYEIYYQLAGYFQALTAFTGLSSLSLARIFSLLLLASLVLLSFRRRDFRPFVLPLLVSAQAWYLYSYANSDAFALTLSIVVAWQAARPDSLLNHFLSETKPRRYLLKLVGLGILLGLLLLLKLYYYAFALFLGLYLLWRIMQGYYPDQKRLWQRIGLLVIVILSVYGARYLMDIHANGLNRAEVMAELQDKYAQPAYKASTPLEQKNPMLELKQRGRSLGYVLLNARWFEKTFKSAFGVYGFADYFTTQSHYDLIRYIALLLLISLIIAAIRSREQGGISLLIVVGFCAASLVAASIWNSWTDSFQPQGRYLFPILPMLAVLYYHIREYALPRLIEWLSILLFLLAAWSFVFTGLANMSAAAPPLL